jgi:hypothetical protein
LSVLILSLVLLSFLLSSLIAYFVTIDIKNILASSEGEEEEEGGGDRAEEQQQDAIEGEEDSIAEDFLEGVQGLEKDQLVSCSEEELLNPDTGECEEIHLQEDIVVNEICNNQEDDDLDGDVDLADADCLPVFTNATNSTSQERMMSLSPPSSLPISPGPDDLLSSEGEEGGGGGGDGAEEQQHDGIEGEEEDSIAEDFLEGVPSSSEEPDLCSKESAWLQLRDIPLPPQCVTGPGSSSSNNNSSTLTPTDSQLWEQTAFPPISIPAPVS